MERGQTAVQLSKLGLNGYDLLSVMELRFAEYQNLGGRLKQSSWPGPDVDAGDDFEIGEEDLTRIFRPDKNGRVKLVDDLKRRVREGRPFPKPDEHMLERLVYLDLFLRTPVVGYAG